MVALSDHATLEFVPELTATCSTTLGRVSESVKAFSNAAATCGQKALEHQVQNMFIKKIPIEFQDEWSVTRRKLAAIVDSTVTEVVIAILILVNLVLSIIATDAGATGEGVPRWVDTGILCFVAFYCAELSLRLYVFRWEFFMSSLNLFDLCVVAADLFCIVLETILSDNLAPDYAPIRIIRVVRLLRSARILVIFRSLYMLVSGMSSAMAAVIWALIMISLALTMCSVFAVEVIQPYVTELATTTDVYLDCPRCPAAYSSVWRAYVTFFQQIVAGDSWGSVAVPVMDAHPWTALFFIPSMLFIQLGLINMILAVIVDKAADARESNCALRLAVKEQQMKDAHDDLQYIFASMDTDRSGELTIDEILTGYDDNKQFQRIIQLMDIGKEDMKCVFNILDQDRSGSCTYTEFVDALWKMKAQDSHTLLVFIKSYVMDVKNSLEESISVLKNDIRIKLGDLHSKGLGSDGMFGHTASTSTSGSRHIAAVDTCKQLKASDDTYLSVRNIDAEGASLPTLLSSKCQHIEQSMSTLSKLFEAPPASVPAKPPAIPDASRRQMEPPSDRPPEEQGGALPLQGWSVSSQMHQMLPVQGLPFTQEQLRTLPVQGLPVALGFHSECSIVNKTPSSTVTVDPPPETRSGTSNSASPLRCSSGDRR